jgi:hypothetical protein
VLLVRLGARRRNETLINREWRYCVHGTGVFKTLVLDASSDDGYGNVVHVEGVQLAGAFAAFATTTVANGGRYDAVPRAAVGVRNLTAGRTHGVDIEQFGACEIHGLVLASSGTAAWITDCVLSAAPPAASSLTSLVQAFDDGNGRSATLDTHTTTTPYPLADPFANLRLHRCRGGCLPRGATIASWTTNGGRRSHPAP